MLLVGLYTPSGSGPSPFPHADKAGHAMAFAAVTATAILSGIPIRWVVGVNAAHAVVSELVQGLFMETRQGDVLDVLADATGITVGLAAALALRALTTALGARGRRSRD